MCQEVRVAISENDPAILFIWKNAHRGCEHIVYFGCTGVFLSNKMLIVHVSPHNKTAKLQS